MTAIATTRTWCVECSARTAFRLRRAVLVCAECSTVLVEREPRQIFNPPPAPQGAAPTCAQGPVAGLLLSPNERGSK